MNLDSYTNIFIIGIKGVAMVHVATILKKMGKHVEGVDVGDEFITDHLLTTAGIRVHTTFDMALPDSVNLVLYSASHKGEHNPLVVQARTRGVRVLSQAAFLGQLMQLFTNRLAVCGCHGKTTTSSLLTYALIQLHVSPSYLIGSSSFNTYDGGDYNGKDWFVIEADEYGVNPPHDLTPKFHLLSPTAVLCTNIDFDHPDVYRDLAHVTQAYRTFLNKAENVVVCGDDPQLKGYAKKRRTRVSTYGYLPGNTYRIVNYETTATGVTFDILHKEHIYEGFQTGIYGEKSILNAAGVVALLHTVGFEIDHIRQALVGFTGPKRRMEVLYVDDRYTVIDDYGHHPDEIRAVIEALRARYDNRRLVVIFQPHTFSRTHAMLDGFAAALALADCAYVAPIFASAREPSDQFHVSSFDIESRAAASGHSHVVAFASKDALSIYAKEQMRAGDVVVTLGAGDIYSVADGIITHIISSSASSS